MSFMSACTAANATAPVYWCCCLSMLMPLHAPSSHVRDHGKPGLTFLLIMCLVDACLQSSLLWYHGLQLQVAHAQICKLSRRWLDIVAALLQHPLQVTTQLR